MKKYIYTGTEKQLIDVGFNISLRGFSYWYKEWFPINFTHYKAYYQIAIHKETKEISLIRLRRLNGSGSRGYFPDLKETPLKTIILEPIQDLIDKGLVKEVEVE